MLRVLGRLISFTYLIKGSFPEIGKTKGALVKFFRRAQRKRSSEARFPYEKTTPYVLLRERSGHRVSFEKPTTKSRVIHQCAL